MGGESMILIHPIIRLGKHVQKRINKRKLKNKFELILQKVIKEEK